MKACGHSTNQKRLILTTRKEEGIETKTKTVEFLQSMDGKDLRSTLIVNVEGRGQDTSEGFVNKKRKNIFTNEPSQPPRLAVASTCEPSPPSEREERGEAGEGGEGPLGRG